MEAFEDDGSVTPSGSQAESFIRLHDQVTQWIDSRDPQIALDPTSLCTAASLIGLVAEGLYAVPVPETHLHAAHLVGVLLQARLEALGDDRSEHDHLAWVSVFAVVHSIDPALIPEPLASAFAADPPARSPMYELPYLMALVLLHDHSRAGGLGVLGTAVTLLQDAVQTAPEEQRPAITFDLGGAWKRLADETPGLPRYLDLAAHEMSRAVTAAVGHPMRPRMWYELALVETERFDRTHDIRRLDVAIDARRAMVSEGSPEPGWWFLLGSSLWQRFRVTRIRKYLDEAIDATAEDIRLAPADYPMLPDVMGSLGNMLLARYAATKDAEDIEAALHTTAAAERIAPPEHPQRAALHHNVRVLTLMHAQAASGAGALEPGGVDDEPTDPATLPGLATGLVERFVRVGDVDDLEAALRIAREAVDSLPGDAAALGALAAARFWQSRYSSEPGELTEAVAAAAAALDTTREDDPARAERLGGLAFMLRIRFENQGNMEDLDASLSLARQAIALTDRDGSVYFTAQTNLSAALLARFVVLREPQDIDDAVSAARHAVDSSPDSAEAGRARTHLAAALNTRYDVRRQEADLDAAIDALRSATTETPPSHTDFPVMRLKLAAALRDRGAPGDLDASVAILRRTVEDLDTRHGDPNIAHARSELAYSLVQRFEAGGGPEDVYEAGHAFRQSAETETATTRTRLFSASRWGGLAMVRGDAAEALAGYRTAVEDLLPRLADRGLSRDSRLAQIAQVPLLASDAAAAAIAVGDLPGAVRLLEQGRSVIWSQLLQTRTDRTELRDRHRALAEEFDAVCAALEIGRPGTDGAPVPSSGRGAQPWQLSKEFDAVLARIRRIPEFARFLEPPTFNELCRAADDGPVAVINISAHRCDALILRSAPGDPPVTLVPLPGVSASEVDRRAAEFLTAVGELSQPRPELGPVEKVKLARGVGDTLSWLWEKITRPVLAALGLDQPGQTPPRLWWCPTGPLTHLPLHAAGSKDGPRVIDLVVSSYTPTLSSLIRARSRPSTRRPRLLGIGVGRQTPGDGGTRPQSDLPGVSTELAVLAEIFGDRHTCRVDEEAVLPAVLSALPSHPWVHFACHGVLSPSDPGNSHLALYDEPLPVTDIAEQDLSGAELAFLSACHTALGNSRLADEAMHLAAAFQLAGYQHVVGTLWALDDGPAPNVARDFYRALEADDSASGSAHALHHAIHRLRRNPDHSSPLHWASYVHLGP
ncbi:CHAT domain-containing protein [Kitasatospora hibisci]|uniref:CHAT domain-containing protein n=1 Tax=Kitasatospora hibisci TaxID=3369522 RepID=UPI003754048C